MPLSEEEASLVAAADVSDAMAVPVVAAASSAPAGGGRRSIAMLAGALAGGNILASLLSVLGGVFQARLVAPTVLGFFRKAGLVLSYAPFLQLGILNGLNRELPYFIGKGDYQRVRELAAAAQAWALAVSGVVAVPLLALAGWSLARGDLWMSAAWASNAVLAVVLFFSTLYLQFTYRTAHDFARLAMINVVQNALALALVALVAVLNFYGLCLRAVLAGLAGAAMLYYWRPVRVGPAWNFAHLKHLLLIGLPIFGVGQIYSLWGALDSTLVWWYLTDEGLGLYALVLMAGSTLELLPGAVTQVLYPRMAEQYGRTHRVRDLLPMCVRPMLVTAVGMTILVAVGWWLVEPVVGLVVPKYVAAIPAMRWGLLAPVINSFAPLNNTFNVVKRQDVYLVAILLGIASYAGSLAWLLHRGLSLVAFPQAMLIGRVVFMVVCYVMLYYLTGRERAVVDAGHNRSTRTDR